MRNVDPMNLSSPLGALEPGKLRGTIGCRDASVMNSLYVFVH